LPGVTAGILGFFGLMSYYSGLATGRMGVVAPVSSLSAVIPLIYSFSIGEHPRGIQIAGMIIALLGAFCASGPEITQGLPIKPTLFGLGAALGFGSALVFMAKGSKVDSLMTMTSMRLATVSICALVALRFRSVGGFQRKDVLLLATVGCIDFLANFLLGIATTKGLVSIAMVLGSLFPIVTVILAFRFLHERLHKVQYAGVILAVAGVALISL
jgi:drug/metabolite transporter (DMT)-like permease